MKVVFSLKRLHSSWSVPHLLTTKKWTLCLDSSHQEQLLPAGAAAFSFMQACRRQTFIFSLSLNHVYTAISSADLSAAVRPQAVRGRKTRPCTQPAAFAALCGQVPQHTISSLPATGTYQTRQLNTDNLPLLHATQKWWTHHTPFTSYSSGMLAPSISKGQESSPQGSEVIPVNPKIPLLSQEQENLLGKSLPFRCWSPHSNRITCCYNSYSARTGLFRTLHSSTENQTTSPVGHHLKPSSGHTGVTLIYIWAVLYNLKGIFCALRSIIASISHMKNRKWSIKVACLMSLSKSNLFLPIVTYNEQHR